MPRTPTIPLAAAASFVALVAFTVSPLPAQTTGSDLVTASVTVASTPVTVTGLQDLLFGTHFATEGVVTNEVDAEWGITGPEGSVVDIAFTALPGFLEDGVGNAVPVIYGATSLALWCDDGAGNQTMVNHTPAQGTNLGCLLFNGGALVELGNGAGFDGNVSVDLTDALDGTYTAVIELTVTIR